jgi:hypothetical protein
MWFFTTIAFDCWIAPTLQFASSFLSCSQLRSQHLDFCLPRSPPLSSLASGAMLAGGEEYFQPPEPIDHDSLRRFAVWCRQLRALERPSKNAIGALSRDGDAVGSDMHVKEVVAGTVLRCIKQSAGTKRYAYWCLLDKMAKDYPSTFQFLFEQHVPDVAADCIEWEDADLARRYEALLEHWDAVFDRQLVQTVWEVRRKERLWAAAHPAEARQQRADEEAAWDREIESQRDAEGLDNYGEPCLAYMQGRCSWGDRCPQLHPPGLEGTLPPECRAGDWRCAGCGMVNRHFRRRCFACMREKPQYKKGAAFDQTPEAVAVSRADPELLAPLSAQFGYDPCDPVAAVTWWSQRLATPALVAQHIDERRRRYHSQILSAVAANVAASGADRRRAREDAAPTSAGDVRPAAAAGAATAPSASTTVDIAVPASALVGTAADRFAVLAGALLEGGVHAPGYLHSLLYVSRVLPELAKQRRAAVAAAVAAGSAPPAIDANLSLVALEVCRMVHASWLATGRRRPHSAVVFLDGVGRDVDALPLVEEHRVEISRLVANAAA